MGTQLQATPALYGKDAEEILKVINLRQPSEKLLQSKVKSQYFKNIKKKGL